MCVGVCLCIANTSVLMTGGSCQRKAMYFLHSEKNIASYVCQSSGIKCDTSFTQGSVFLVGKMEQLAKLGSLSNNERL